MTHIIFIWIFLTIHSTLSPCLATYLGKKNAYFSQVISYSILAETSHRPLNIKRPVLCQIYESLKIQIVYTKGTETYPHNLGDKGRVLWDEGPPVDEGNGEEHDEEGEGGMGLSSEALPEAVAELVVRLGVPSKQYFIRKIIIKSDPRFSYKLSFCIHEV